MSKKVFIVTNNYRGHFITMFTERGYEVVDNIADADVVQFTGGEDIDPAFYGQHEHRTTYTSPRRDKEELDAFEKAAASGKFLAGVCRGGQLLNALNGGELYQDVGGHGLAAGHGMEDVTTGEIIQVSSLHHQMMIMGSKATLLGKADYARSKYKRKMSSSESSPEELVSVDENVEVEACWYPETRSFCFQPHPEFCRKESACQEWYFKKLEELFEV